MKKIILAIALMGIAPLYAQPTGALNTSGVGIDSKGKCWKQGPANALTEVLPVLGTAVTITSATQVLTKGSWLIVTGSTAHTLVSDGTTQTGVATGNAYPL